MSFCSSCGAQNSDDARFCNKCGTKIDVAAAASPAAAPAPAPTNTGGTVTLTGIGIQSPGRAYGVLALGALAFLGLGVLIAWFGMRGATATPTATEDGVADATDATGDGVPEGVDVPDEDFDMTGGHGSRRPGGGASGSSDGTGGTATGSGTTAPTTGTSGRTPPATRTGTATGTGTGTGTGTRPTSSGTGSTGSTGTPIDPPPSSTTSGSGTPPPTSSVDWASMEGSVPTDDPDYEMEMYYTQVRRFMRQNLLPQTTSCFEHASATSRDPVHGRIVIGFDINARGHAEHAAIVSNTTGNDTLARCVMNNVGTWQLPPPPADSAPIPMQVPFSR